MGSSFSEEHERRRALMEAIFREHFTEVHRYISSKVRQPDVADDLTRTALPEWKRPTRSRCRHPLTPRSQQILARAGREARDRGETAISPHHILHALQSEERGYGIVRGIVQSLGVGRLKVKKPPVDESENERALRWHRNTSHPEETGENSSMQAIWVSSTLSTSTV